MMKNESSWACMGSRPCGSDCSSQCTFQKHTHTKTSMHPIPHIFFLIFGSFMMGLLSFWYLCIYIYIYIFTDHKQCILTSVRLVMEQGNT